MITTREQLDELWRNKGWDPSKRLVHQVSITTICDPAGDREGVSDIGFMTPVYVHPGAGFKNQTPRSGALKIKFLNREPMTLQPGEQWKNDSDSIMTL